jgi:hypothetical protein
VLEPCTADARTTARLTLATNFLGATFDSALFVASADRARALRVLFPLGKHTDERMTSTVERWLAAKRRTVERRLAKVEGGREPLGSGPDGDLRSCRARVETHEIATGPSLD